MTDVEAIASSMMDLNPGVHMLLAALLSWLLSKTPLLSHLITQDHVIHTTTRFLPLTKDSLKCKPLPHNLRGVVSCLSSDEQLEWPQDALSHHLQAMLRVSCGGVENATSSPTALGFCLERKLGSVLGAKCAHMSDQNLPVLAT